VQLTDPKPVSAIHILEKPSPEGEPASPWSAPLVCLALYLALTAILLLCCLHLNGGHFVYVLDDPYIHLELARNIARGTYGINPHEFSSPSSSILWPFLLIAGVESSWHHLLPFVWNLIFGSAAAMLLGHIVDQWGWPQEGSAWPAKRGLMCLMMILTANLVALAFVGMEHSLQVLLTIGAACGILEVLQDRPMPAWCIACAALSPAIRYENFAVVVSVVIALVAQKRYKTAGVAGGLSLIVPLLFSSFLLAHGPHALPNSVVAKAQIQNYAGSPAIHLGEIVRVNLKHALRAFRFIILLALMAGLACKASGKRSLVLWGVTATLLLQLMFGKFGWFARYDVYAVIFGATVSLAEMYRLRVRWFYAAFALTLFSVPYVRVTSQIPLASFGVYAHEFQMRRFFRDYYRKDVAVDDLGLASYQRLPGTYVLDLDGLGSNEALATGLADPEALNALVHRHRIGLATQWPTGFTPPSSWQAVGAIFSRDESENAEAEHAMIYVTADGDKDEVRRELQAFRSTLPPNVGIRIW
jgi:hypothetical protein